VVVVAWLMLLLGLLPRSSITYRAVRFRPATSLDATGRRLTRFRVSHSRDGLAELVRHSRPASWQAAGAVFAFEATGHVWEALAERRYIRSSRGLQAGRG
jgi:hypothetical protein